MGATSVDMTCSITIGTVFCVFLAPNKLWGTPGCNETRVGYKAKKGQQAEKN